MPSRSITNSRNDRTLDATGLIWGDLCAVLAITTAYLLDEQPTTGPEAGALLDKLGDHSGRDVAKRLVSLSRRGWVRVARWRGNTAYYEPTRLALQKCDEWTGRNESVAAE